jgi:putative FmdB family regulatory protein
MSVLEGLTMPMFDYQCSKCGDVSEYIVKTPEEKGLKCKACGAGGLKRLLGAATVVANPNHREPTNFKYPKNPLYS